MALTPWNRQEEWYQQMINASTGNYLPSISAQDAGKVMTVESDGSWGVENVPQELPAVETTDKDKYLHTDASTGELEWSEVQGGGSELPAVTASDAGKVLTVQAQATKGTVIVPEQSIASYSSHNAVLSNTNNTPFVDGASVIVTADGVDYVATVIDNKGELQAYFMENYSAGIILSDNTMKLYDSTNTIAEISVNLVNISGVWGAQDNDVELNASISFGTQPYPITITSQLPSMSKIASWYENGRTILLRFPQNNWSIRLMPTSAESPSEESPIIYSWTSDANGIDGDRMHVVVTFVQSGLSTLAFGGVLAGERYVVTLTPTAADYSGTMDKTVAEINTAYEAGQQIVFRVYTAAGIYNEADCAVRYKNNNFTYPSFNAYIVDNINNVLIFAYTGINNDGTAQTYSANVYTLTPAT